jgi:hypothetical protein
MAAFHLIIYGRFWAITEAQTRKREKKIHVRRIRSLANVHA